MSAKDSEAPRVIGLIPARLAATRLPNKPLIDIAGRPMIQRVWERAGQARLLHAVAIATPDDEIADVCRQFGAQVVRTRADHRSGTDRLAEASEILQLPDEAIVVNIQGDEPLLDPQAIDAAITLLLYDSTLQMTSLRCPCPVEDWDNPGCVKVVCAANGDALYFSRARLPFQRNVVGDGVPVWQHVGLYAYRRGFLARFAALAPTPLEITESLEQLRVLENGYRIRMVAVAAAPIGVDTPDDLARVRALLTPER